MKMREKNAERRALPAPAPSWRRPPRDAGASLGASWAIIAAVSAIPYIVAAELFHSAPPWIELVQIGIPLAVLVASTVVRRLRPLRRFCAVIAALLILLAITAHTESKALLRGVLGSDGFVGAALADQTVKLGVAVTMILVLILLGYRRRDFFLRAGDPGARIRPVPLLGFPHRDSWRRFGLTWGFGVAIVLGAIQFSLLQPTAADVAALWPVLPWVLILAALNAFSEEMTYRAPLLASLEPAVGSGAALWQSAVFFGVAHYFGVPGGLLGAAASVFMGWLLSKAMLETRGLFWPWFIHFLSDVAIFASLA